MTDSNRLLAWYDATRRDLPWRRSRDPYLIWVSEVMLQQTRVETVIPYFEGFLRRFPTVRTLADADLDDVLAAWSGLGYYRRARQLHAAARQIVASGGELPATVDELRQLPGIGPYTAAAVASIAFDVPAPVLDGNVERVLSRRLALEGDPRRGEARRELLEAARGLLPPGRPGDGNQALMELGATICTPKSPRCGDCPLAAGCRAYASGDPEAYPRLPARRKPVRQRRIGVVARRDSKTLLFRRPDDSELLAGTWEIPWVAIEKGDDTERRLSESYGGVWELGERAGRVKHSITHRALEVDVVLGRYRDDGTIAEGVEAGWFTASEIENLASSSLVGKILRRVGASP